MDDLPKLTVGELIDQLSQLDRALPVKVWMPGSKIVLASASKQYDHSKGEWIAMVEGNVEEGTISGYGNVRAEIVNDYHRGAIDEAMATSMLVRSGLAEPFAKRMLHEEGMFERTSDEAEKD